MRTRRASIVAVASAAALTAGLAAPSVSVASSARDRAERRVSRVAADRWWRIIRGRTVLSYCRGRGSRWSCRYDVLAGFSDGERCGRQGRRRCPDIVMRGRGRVRGSRVTASKPYRVEAYYSRAPARRT